MTNPTVSQTGIPFEVEIIEEDQNGTQTPLDPTGATTKQIEFFGPQGINFKKNATESTSGGNWFLTYTDPDTSSILTKAGWWKMRHYIVKSDGKLSIGNKFVEFEVDP